MKKLIILTLLLLLCAVPLFAHEDKRDAFSLQITITRGERSKDSNAATIELTITNQTLLYRKTYSGRLRGRAPEQKEFKLNAEDQRNLVKLIKDRNLLRTDSIEREQAASGMYLYFELSIKPNVDKSAGFIYIKGSRKAVALKEESLYRDAVALLEEIYRIINRTDKAIVYEPLIR